MEKKYNVFIRPEDGFAEVKAIKVTEKQAKEKVDEITSGKKTRDGNVAGIPSKVIDGNRNVYYVPDA